MRIAQYKIERLERRCAKTSAQLRAANEMLERIHGICDEAGIPRTDGDISTLEIQFCEGHRVKIMAEKLKRMAAMPNDQKLSHADGRVAPQTR